MRLRTKTIRRNHDRLYATLNPALPSHPRHLHLIYTDHLTAEHLPHLLHIEAEAVESPPAGTQAQSESRSCTPPVQGSLRPRSLLDMCSLAALIQIMSYSTDEFLSDFFRVPVSEIQEIRKTLS